MRLHVVFFVIGLGALVIGLTTIAAGTSMHEVATSIMAAIGGERDIAVGNVTDSNTFNILGCLGISGSSAVLASTSPPPYSTSTSGS